MRTIINKRNLVSVMLIIAIIFMSVVCATEESMASSTPTTKSQVEKQLKETQKEIKALEKKNNAQWKGKTLLMGAIKQTDPLVVQPLGTNNFYYVKNSKNLISGFPVYGAVTLSGKYQYVNGYYCRIVYAKKIDTKISKKLNNAKAKKEKLQAALSNKFLFGGDEYYVKIGEKVNLKQDGKMKSDKEKYNKISWTSSNNSIATVSKNGVVTAKKEGTVTITAKTSISGKKTSCKVKCYDNMDDIHFEKSEYIFDANNYDETIELKLVSSNQDVLDCTNIDYWNLRYEYVNSYVNEWAEIDRYPSYEPSMVRLHVVTPADFKLTLITEEGKAVSCNVKFTNSKYNNMKPEQVQNVENNEDEEYINSKEDYPDQPDENENSSSNFSDEDEDYVYDSPDS